MHFKISYFVKDGDAFKRHNRYYNALDKATAVEMFEASKEESLVGEDPEIEDVYVNEATNNKKYNWANTDEEKAGEV